MQEIRIGQLFCKTDAVAMLWEVVGFVEDGAGIRHVRLRNVRDVFSSKLISEAALRNGRLFRPAGTRQAAEA